ncbi:MAG TPA: GAF domain-containing sensor histidine kinase, partial [Anaerolineales bacterium]|nr:GAF domain-containing sensor histidine kinase [Anaerolineales bacterium]
AVALENARIYQEEQERRLEAERRRRVAESLRDILTVINSARPLEEILACIVEQAAQLMRSDAGVIYCLNHQSATLEIVASCGLPESFAGAGRMPVYRGGAVQALLDRKPYIIPDIQRHLAQITQQTEIHSETKVWLQQLFGSFASYLGIPLVIRDELYGSLSLYHFDVREFSEEEVQLIVTFADQAALAIENARLRAEAARSAAAAERSRLARDLHDAVTQTLFSASLIAEVLPRLFERDQAEGEKRLEELRQLTRGALAEMRTLLLELRPAALIEAELGELFRHLADAFVGRTRIPVEVEVQGSYNPPPDVKVAMYRIVQEALNNVNKHAEAGQVWLYIKSRDERVELDIRDDGVGFDPATIPPEHLGIGIMKERAEAVGAQLSMESRPGAGTHIAFTWEQPS